MPITDIASIGFEVDTRQLKQGQVELNNMAKAGANAETAVDKFGNALTDNDRAAGRFIDANGRMREANGRFVQGLGQSRSGLLSLEGALTAVASVLTVREVIQYSDAWTNTQNQLRQVTDTTEQLASVTQELLSTANDTRSSYEATANLYARLARSTTELNLSQQDLVDLTETINQSFAVSGATAEEAAAAITQLSQGLAAGALRGDEFNSVAESAPGILRAIASSLDLTIGELREFAAEGGITAEIVVNALQGASEAIANDFGESVASFGQQATVANNNLTEFIGSSELVSSVSSAAGSSLVTLSENLDTIAGVTLGVAAAAGTYTAATRAATVATVAFNAAASLNPFVAIARVVGVASAALLGYAVATRDSTNPTRVLRQEVEGLSDAYADLTLNQLQNELLRLTNELRRVQEEQIRVRQSAQDANAEFANSTNFLGKAALATASTAVETGKLREQNTSLEAAIIAVGKQIASLTTAKDKDTSSTSRNTDAVNEATSATERYIERLRRQNELFGLSRSAQERYNARAMAAAAATAEESFEILALGNALANKIELDDEAAASSERLADAERLAQRETEALQNEFESLSDSITDAILNFESLGDVASSVLNSIARSFVQSGVNNLLSSFGVPGAPSGGSLFSGFQSNIINSIGQATGLTDLLTPSSLVGPSRLTDAFSGSAGLIAGAFALPVLLSLQQLFSGGAPRLTFSQGSDPISVNTGGFSRTGDDIVNTAFQVGQRVSTPFGDFGVFEGDMFREDVSDEVVNGFLSLVQTIDESIASAISPEELTNVTDALSNVQTFLGEYEQFLGEGESITRQFNVGVFGREGADPADQIISRYELILGEALPRAIADQLLEQTDDIQQFAASTTLTLDQLSRSSDIFNGSLDDLSDSYSRLSLDGESALEFFSRANNQYISELSLLAQEIGAAGSSIQSLNSLGVSIRQSLLSDEELYGQLEVQAETLARSIETLTDPAQVASAVDEIQNLTSRAFGLLDDQQQQELGAGIADFIDEVTAASAQRVAELAEQRQDELSSIDNLLAGSQNISTAADSFQLAIGEFGQMINDLRAFISTQSNREVVTYVD